MNPLKQPKTEGLVRKATPSKTDAQEAVNLICNSLKASNEYSVNGKNLDVNISLKVEGARRRYAMTNGKSPSLTSKKNGTRFTAWRWPLSDPTMQAGPRAAGM